MKKITIILCLFISCFWLSSCSAKCEHNYMHISSVESTCVQKGFELFECVNCKELKKEDKELLLEHNYETNSTCVDRHCIEVGCEHVEQASTQHVFNREYVCSLCNEKKPCSLEIIQDNYGEVLLSYMSSWEGFGSLEIVILDAQTIKSVRTEDVQVAYVDGRIFDKNKIVKGLFIKLNSKETLGEDLYFTFGYEMSEAQSSDIAVFAMNTGELWYLEVVEGNKTIVFQYSVLDYMVFN